MKIIFSEIACDWALVTEFTDTNPEAQQAMRDTVAELNRIIDSTPPAITIKE